MQKFHGATRLKPWYLVHKKDNKRKVYIVIGKQLGYSSDLLSFAEYGMFTELICEFYIDAEPFVIFIKNVNLSKFYENCICLFILSNHIRRSKFI